MNQKTLLTNLCVLNPNATIVGSIGTISYDLTEIPHNNKILLRGAMGAALACGLGIALAKPEESVIVVIGDGSLLMKLGSISTVLRVKPKNLRVIVINNGSYKSCGGQKTNFNCVKDWVAFLPNFEVHDF